MSKTMPIVVGVILVILIVGGFFAFNNFSSSKPAPSASAEVQASPIDSPMDMGVTKEFTVSGSNYKFEPATLTVNKGDKVKITFQNSGGIHDFVIDGFNVMSKQIKSGETDTVEFSADKAGSFEYYCSVGNHRAMGMKGTLTVN